MRRTSTRRARKARPGLEGLEGRQLLSSGVTGPDTGDLTAQAMHRGEGMQRQDRRVSYTTPQGSRVTVTLYGRGSLAGTTQDPDGALNLVFSRTNHLTGIVARVSGGTGRAPLRSIRHADLGLDNFSGVGSTLLNVVNFKDFDLVDGGQINLTGGVHTLFLNSAGRNTQIHLRELPAQFTTNPTSGAMTTNSNGVTLGFVDDVTGARTLTSTAGTIITGFSLLANAPRSSATIGVDPGPPPAPPGIIVSIGSVNGPARASTGLGNAQVFGYDPVVNSLIRFDTVTGDALQTIPLTGLGTGATGVALGRNRGRLVALVGSSTTVYAFDAVSGNPVGQFSTANLAAGGLDSIDAIGSTDTRTILVDSTAGPGGLARRIDVTRSLDTGQAVTVGDAFAPQRQFGFSGGLTGVAASNTVYASGAGFFDTAQPNLTQAGVMAISTAGNQLREASRTALRIGGGTINEGPIGTPQLRPFQAMGSVDQNLAIVTGVDDGQNVVSLFAPENLSSQGSFRLNVPNLLTGLSESFRPDLVDAALVDVQGNLQSFRADSARGLFLNDLGAINLVKIKEASDTTIVGLPVGHVAIPRRSNVTILSTGRNLIVDRNGVTIDDTLRPVGPLSLPTPTPVRTAP